MNVRLLLCALPCLALLGLAPAGHATGDPAADEGHAGHEGHAAAAAPSGHEGHAGHEGHGSHGEPLPGDDPLPDRSLYQLEGDWTDAAGRAAPLSRLRGTPVFVAMFYGTCTSVCPALIEDMKRVEASLSEADRARTRFALVTFDPAQDTPEQLLALARKRELDPSRWTLLHGKPDQVREVAAVLGVRYRPIGDGHFSHTARISLLDAEGVVVSQADGVERPTEQLTGPLAGLLAGKGAR